MLKGPRNWPKSYRCRRWTSCCKGRFHILVSYFKIKQLCLIILTYRAAITAKAAAGKWTEGNLDKYLKSPADYAPGNFCYFTSCLILLNLGNAMAFAGIANGKDRADLIAYLKTKSQ